MALHFFPSPTDADGHMLVPRTHFLATYFCGVLAGQWNGGVEGVYAFRERKDGGGESEVQELTCWKCGLGCGVWGEQGGVPCGGGARGWGAFWAQFILFQVVAGG